MNIRWDENLKDTSRDWYLQEMERYTGEDGEERDDEVDVTEFMEQGLLVDAAANQGKVGIIHYLG